MEIQSLDKQALKDLMDIIEARLKDIGGEFGIDLKLSGGTIYSDQAATLKLDVTIQGTGSVRAQRMADGLKAYADLYFPGVDLENPLPLPHPKLGPIKVVGFNPRAQKLPVIVEDSKGKRWRLEIDAIKRMAK